MGRLIRRRAGHATLIGVAGGLCLGVGAAGGVGRRSRAPSVVEANPNTVAAGTLPGRVLSLTLEAKLSRWYLDGPRNPAITVAAFSEPEKPPLMPAPLLRVPAGTELRVTIRNSLSQPLTLLVPTRLRTGGERGEVNDSVVVLPGRSGTLTTRADIPGNYAYYAVTPFKSGKPHALPPSGVLGGAIVVDTAGAAAAPRDRVFVMMGTHDSAETACVDTASANNPVTNARACGGERLHYTINGLSWPSTERIHATVGDTLRWRVINLSRLEHPMHLHGFYYRVDSYSAPTPTDDAPIVAGQMVVTQKLPPLAGMTMTWSPDRPGNWLFHCHIAMHTTLPEPAWSADSPTMSGAPDMVGLILGTIVSPRAGVVSAGRPNANVRRLRLVAEQGQGVLGHALWRTPMYDSLPEMHFVLEENGHRVDTRTDFSPELDLVRGEPVAITVVNHLTETTTVHWHGIELEDSYMDGAADFGGTGAHLAPAIAPGDSFVARFTPPRAGTFMYHAHVDDVRQQLAGLEGALVVRDRGAASTDDQVFFLKGLRNSAHPLEISGRANPDTVVLHIGRTARLRFMNLAMNLGSPVFSLTARPDSVGRLANDTMLVRWRVLAKDAFDLPADAQISRPAEVTVAIGETWDVAFVPERRGPLNLEIRDGGPGHQLSLRVPIRVE